MGKVIKWLKGLFTTKQSNGQVGIGGGGGAGLCHNPTTIPPNITPAEAAWLSSFYGHSSGKEHNNSHAIVVAAVTAAAADAAVAAAHAAATVVRLTSRDRGGAALFCREKLAAIRIQAAFRGYLARKALRCLKGLVKIQAILRGYLVRKQASATLHSMQALMRAQATVLAQKSRPSILTNQTLHPPKPIERNDETRSERIMSIHSGRHFASFESENEATTKVVEMDPTVRPKTRRSRRSNTWVAEAHDDPFGPSHSSPLPCRIPDRRDPDLIVDECRFLTAQSTPRLVTSGSSTPSKSVCLEGYFRNYDGFPQKGVSPHVPNSQHYEEFPKYMASTKSFMLKLRSQSAPKQRPEPVTRKMESRASQSGVRMQKSCSHAQEVINFKSAVVGRLGRCTDFPYIN